MLHIVSKNDAPVRRLTLARRHIETAIAHINELNSGNYNRLPTSIGIWDAQFNGAGWLNAAERKPARDYVSKLGLTGRGFRPGPGRRGGPFGGFAADDSASPQKGKTIDPADVKRPTNPSSMLSGLSESEQKPVTRMRPDESSAAPNAKLSRLSTSCRTSPRNPSSTAAWWSPSRSPRFWCRPASASACRA